MSKKFTSILLILLLCLPSFADTSFTENLKNSPNDLWSQTLSLKSSDIYPYLIIGGLGTAAALAYDDDVRDYFLEHEPLGDGKMDLGNKYLGNGIALMLSSFTIIGMGTAIENEKLIDTGFAVSEALIIEGTIVLGIKTITQRERPDGSSKNSFPSGHVGGITAFTMTIADMYDATIMQKALLSIIPAYVGACRIQADKHHLSDVIAGYTVGLYVANKVSEHWKSKDTNWSIIPILDEESYGFGFMSRF